MFSTLSCINSVTIARCPGSVQAPIRRMTFADVFFFFGEDFEMCLDFYRIQVERFWMQIKKMVLICMLTMSHLTVCFVEDEEMMMS